MKWLSLHLIIWLICTGLAETELPVQISYKRSANGRQEVEYWELRYTDNTTAISSNMFTNTEKQLSIENKDYVILHMHSLDGQYPKNSWIEFKRGDYIIFKSVFKEGTFTISIALHFDRQQPLYSLEYRDNWTVDNHMEWLSYGKVDENSSSSVWYFYLSRSFSRQVMSYLMKYKYKDGIVAYCNGKEVFRDNMPEGPILPNTPPTSEYSTQYQKSIVRSGSDLYEEGYIYNHFAVEIHLKNPECFKTFEMFILLLSSTFPDQDGGNQCAVYPTNTQFTLRKDDEVVDSALDHWDNSQAVQFSSFTDTTFLQYEFENPVQITSWYLFVPNACAPTTYSVLYRRTKDSSWELWSEEDESTRIAESGKGEGEYIFHMSNLRFQNSQAVRWIPRSSSCSSFSINRLHPLICRRQVDITEGTLQFPSNIVIQEGVTVEIAPTSTTGTVSCKTNSTLPKGLTLSSNCILSGNAKEPLIRSEIDLFWYNGLRTVHSTFFLEVTGVSHTNIIASICWIVALVLALYIVYMCYHDGLCKNKRRPVHTPKHSEKGEIEMTPTKPNDVPTNNPSPSPEPVIQTVMPLPADSVIAQSSNSVAATFSTANPSLLSTSIPSSTATNSKPQPQLQPPSSPSSMQPFPSSTLKQDLFHPTSEQQYQQQQQSVLNITGSTQPASSSPPPNLLQKASRRMNLSDNSLVIDLYSSPDGSSVIPVSSISTRQDLSILNHYPGSNNNHADGGIVADDLLSTISESTNETKNSKQGTSSHHNQGITPSTPNSGSVVIISASSPSSKNTSNVKIPPLPPPPPRQLPHQLPPPPPPPPHQLPHQPPPPPPHQLPHQPPRQPPPPPPPPPPSQQPLQQQPCTSFMSMKPAPPSSPRQQLRYYPSPERPLSPPSPPPPPHQVLPPRQPQQSQNAVNRNDRSMYVSLVPTYDLTPPVNTDFRNVHQVGERDKSRSQRETNPSSQSSPPSQLRNVRNNQSRPSDGINSDFSVSLISPDNNRQQQQQQQQQQKLHQTDHQSLASFIVYDNSGHNNH